MRESKLDHAQQDALRKAITATKQMDDGHAERARLIAAANEELARLSRPPDISILRTLGTDPAEPAKMASRIELLSKLIQKLEPPDHVPIARPDHAPHLGPPPDEVQPTYPMCLHAAEGEVDAGSFQHDPVEWQYWGKLGEGGELDWLVDPKTPVLRMRRKSNAVGGDWGILAIAARPAFRRDLWFTFTPPDDGILRAVAYVHVVGRIFTAVVPPGIVSLPTVYAQAAALVKCTLHTNHGIASSPPSNYSLVNIWGVDDVIIDNYVTVETSVYGIEADVPAVLQVSVELQADGHSQYGWADADFFTNGRGFYVPAACITVSPEPLVS